jgi:hypothetical protein
MKRARNESWKNFTRLLRFVLWYAIFLAAVFYVLPMAGRLVEASYDAMSSVAKLFMLAGFLVLVFLWQRRGRRNPGE